MTVAKWGRDVVMTNQIATVRQNLDLIVDNSKAVPGLRNPKSTKWGTVVNPNDDVWRSGLGITPTGALVYVGGPGMSLSDLAERDAARRRRRGHGARLRPRLGAALDLHRRARHGDRREPTGRASCRRCPARRIGTSGRSGQHDFFTMSLRDNELRRTVSTTSTTTTTTTTHARASGRRPFARSAWGGGATSRRRSAGSAGSR